MAQFKLEITGDLSELPSITARLAGTTALTPVAQVCDPTRLVPVEEVDELPSAEAQDPGLDHQRTVNPAPAADKPKRTRKATAVDAIDMPTVDRTAEPPSTLKDQIAAVVAADAAEQAALPQSEAAATGPSPAAPAATLPGTAAPSDTASLTAACQGLVKSLITKLPTQEVLNALEPFGGKAVSAIAKDKPENLPGLYAKLCELNGGPAA